MADILTAVEQLIQYGVKSGLLHREDIVYARNRLLAAKVSEEQLKKIDAEVREIVNASADFAQHDPEPDPSELWTDIYR